jgi:putative IMPACT (imprinted ancient) family translation regulator
VLRGAGLSDAMAVVVRWFGGTKLGKGGLARAYAAATREALAGLPVAARVPTVEVAVAVPYERVGAVKRLIHPPEVELVSEEYGEQARLVLAVHAARREGLAAALADLGIRAN